MKPSTKDRMKGRLETLKGKGKEAVGVLTGQRKLEAEGKRQARSGKAKEKLGQIEKVLGK